MVCNKWSIAAVQSWLAFICFCVVFRGGSCCLREWLRFRDQCFQFRTRHRTMLVAQLDCQLSGGDLASIPNEDVLQFIALQAAHVPVSSSRFWVGLRRKDTENGSRLQWLDATNTENQSWIVSSYTSTTDLYNCYVYNGAIVSNEPCDSRNGFICSYHSSKTSVIPRQLACNPSVTNWQEETFLGETSGKCIFRAPGLTTKEMAEEKCFEYWGDFLDLDGILMDSMSILHQTVNESSRTLTRKLTNDGYRYWTDLIWNGTNLLWSTRNSFGEEMDLPVISGSGSCVTVQFNFTDVLDIHLYQTECDSVARVFCAGSVVTTTERRTTTERPMNDSPSSLSCPDGYNWKEDRSSNYCYWETSFETERLSWYDAENYCQSFGGHLASLHSIEEEKIGLSFQYTSLAHPYWIGLKLDVDTETYSWSDGTPLDYRNWGPGHPDHRDKMLRCVAMEAKEAHWKASLCGILSWFICKVPKQLHPTVAVVPTPTPLKSCDAQNDGNEMVSLKSFYFEGSCYFMISETVSWHRAKQFCENEGATLVSIHTDEEIGFLLKLLYDNSPDSNRLWIGLNALEGDGSFHWTDWSPVDFTYFNKDEPNNYQNQEKCCNMYAGIGLWNDENCNAQLSFICKRRNDTSSSTTPPSTIDPRIGNCKKGWIAYHDRCYFVGGHREKDRVNWTQALQICNDNGGYLTSIRNENEQAFLAYLLQSLRLDAWIGLHDTLQSGRYYWLDNSDLQYTNWAIGEPSFFGVKEDCVKMIYNDHESGVWKDDECEKRFGYICQNRKDPSLPEPEYDRGINCLQPEGWLKLDNLCFKMFEGNTLTWAEAESSCRRDGGHLVSISDKSVKAVVSYLAKEVNKPFWIGLRYKESSQTMSWLNGWPMTLTSWEKNEPGSLKEDTCFSSTSEGYWKKAACDDEMPYVCQITTGKPTKQKMYTGDCPLSSKHWTPGNGSHCYILEKDDRMDWFSANLKCFSVGSHLASIHSMSEIENIKKLMKPGIRSVYIGMHRHLKGGFAWVDESPVDFVNWDEVPDSSTRDQCVEMLADTLKWRTAPCAAKKHLICKSNKATVIYGDPKSAKRTEGPPVGLTSSSMTAIIVCITIALIIIVSAALYYSKTVLAKNRLRNPFQPQSAVSFENALYDVDTSSMEFHDEQKSYL